MTAEAPPAKGVEVGEDTAGVAASVGTTWQAQASSRIPPQRFSSRAGATLATERIRNGYAASR